MENSMTKNSLLNKPIILSFLLFLITSIISILLGLIIKNTEIMTFLIMPIMIFSIAFSMGFFQENLKITLDKIKKIKIAVYFSMIQIILFIPIGMIFSYFVVEHHIVVLITALIFTIIYIILGLFLYLGLLLGDKIALINKVKN